LLQSTRAIAATASWRVPVCEHGDDLNDAGPVGVVVVSELEQAHSAQSAVGANRRRIVEEGGAMRIMIAARER
jgi:hypothetical protein